MRDRLRPALLPRPDEGWVVVDFSVDRGPSSEQLVDHVDALAVVIADMRAHNTGCRTARRTARGWLRRIFDGQCIRFV